MKPMKFKEEMKKLIQGKVQKRENIFMSFSYNWIHDLLCSILTKIELLLKLWFISLIITNFNFNLYFLFCDFFLLDKKAKCQAAILWPMAAGICDISGLKVLQLI